MLARDTSDRLVGCGTLRQARPEAGELKRLYMRSDAAAHGRGGRKLIEARIRTAP